ncbi:MAG: IS1595 family transposase [Clostridiales bacterium]|jgi:ribosomal protein L37AE/L43A|nr:IS1595 family transposase [Clostridiales bacterium]
MDYLFQLRWSDGFVCPKCGGGEYRTAGTALFECKDCGHQASVIAGTIFQDARRPSANWFTAIWRTETRKYGASTEGLKQAIGLSSCETAWTWLHKIRSAMVRSDRAKLSGIVEVDETYIGGGEHSGGASRGTGNKALAAIVVELKPLSTANKTGLHPLGRVRLFVVADASAESLKPFIEDNIEKEGKVITDGWASYSFVASNWYAHTVHVGGKKSEGEQMLPHAHLAVC